MFFAVSYGKWSQIRKCRSGVIPKANTDFLTFHVRERYLRHNPNFDPGDYNSPYFIDAERRREKKVYNISFRNGKVVATLPTSTLSRKYGVKTKKGEVTHLSDDLASRILATEAK